MPSWIVKLADDAYVEWSTVVDAPTSYVTKRAQAVVRWGDDRVARADDHIISVRLDDEALAMDPGLPLLVPASVEEFVSHNRAGDGESCLTLAEILDAYDGPQPDRTAHSGHSAVESVAAVEPAGQNGQGELDGVPLKGGEDVVPGPLGGRDGAPAVVPELDPPAGEAVGLEVGGVGAGELVGREEDPSSLPKGGA